MQKVKLSIASSFPASGRWCSSDQASWQLFLYILYTRTVINSSWTIS